MLIMMMMMIVMMMMMIVMMMMMMMMMQGDITADRASLTVAKHRDKVVNVRSEFLPNQNIFL